MPIILRGLSIISTIGDVSRYLGYIENTAHCRDRELAEYAFQLKDYIFKKYGKPRIVFIGLQPAMVESLASVFPIRVVGLDKENIDIKKNGITIEDILHTEGVIS